MKTHYLKTWPEYFKAVKNGSKPFEVRVRSVEDEEIEVGDVLILEEWVPEKEKYTGDKLFRLVTYILHGGKFGLEPSTIVMGIKNP